MKKTLMDLLCCPVCKGTLNLHIEKEEGGEIISGSLQCTHCKVSYPISEGIPDLLPREPEKA
jgi:uncharacterized protein